MTMPGGAHWIKERPIAHRGFHDQNDKVWENTLSAFKRAVDGNYPIECDLQLSSDGVPIVFHDYVLDRLCARDGDVKEFSSDQLKEMRVGGTDDKIPTLAEMLSEIDGQVGLVIELKPQDAARNRDFAAAVLNCLEGYEGHAVLMSFDRELVRALVEMGARIPVGLTAHGNDPEQMTYNLEALDIPIDFVSFHVSDLPSEFVKTVRDKNLPAITWTVRNQGDWDLSKQYADQITFEGFDPDRLQR